MNKQSNTKNVVSASDFDAGDKVLNTLPAQVNASSVSQFLLENPNFLVEHPDLLSHIHIVMQEAGAVSLTQIQAEQSREKIKQLKSQLDTFMNTARKNELIYSTYAKLNLALAKAHSITQIESCIEHHLVTTLALESVTLVLLDSPKHKATHTFSEIQHRSIFEKKLAKQPFYFGRVGKIEREALFPNAQASSVAMVLLHNDENIDEVIGLLAIASNDEMHFKPDMDTSLVDFLRLNLNYHLSRLI